MHEVLQHDHDLKTKETCKTPPTTGLWVYAYTNKGKQCMKDEMSFQFFSSGYALVVNCKPGDVSLCVLVCVCVLCGCAKGRHITVQRNKFFLNLCAYTFETYRDTDKKRKSRQMLILSRLAKGCFRLLYFIK